MNIPSVSSQNFQSNDASSVAAAGIQQQNERLEYNVAELANSQGSESGSLQTTEQSLVEQLDIVNSVQANARALEAANERVGTLIDIKV